MAQGHVEEDRALVAKLLDLVVEVLHRRGLDRQVEHRALLGQGPQGEARRSGEGLILRDRPTTGPLIFSPRRKETRPLFWIAWQRC